MTITYDGATDATRQIIHHHAALRRGLEQRVGALCEAGDGAPARQALADLRDYLDQEILPHAAAEERALYPAAAAQARGGELVRTLIAEHGDLAGLIRRLEPGPDGAQAAIVGEWIATLFAGHVAKENDLLLPALTGSGADLAALLTAMHEPPASARV